MVSIRNPRPDCNPLVALQSWLASNGQSRLNEAQEMGVWFLLIDADFAKIDAETLKSQFARGVSWHQLPSAWDRPLDIPYVFASCLRSVVTQRDTQFSIEASALVAIIEWMLHEKKNYGNLATLAKEIVAKHRNTDAVRVVWNDLPETIKRKSEPYRVPNVADYIPRFE